MPRTFDKIEKELRDMCKDANSCQCRAAKKRLSQQLSESDVPLRFNGEISRAPLQHREPKR